MKNIARLTLPKKTKPERDNLMQQVSQFIRSHLAPVEIIFFGSIISDNFDDMSDIDVVVILGSAVEATEARKKLYTADRSFSDRPIEFLCVDKLTFEQKSDVGGVYFTAKESGIKG